MAGIGFITYIPLIAKLIEHACATVTKHRDKIASTADTVWPGHSTEVNAALDAVVTACATFNSLLAALRVWQAAH
jgi:hypothetical protein